MPRAAPDIAGFAISANLGFVAPECTPSFDLGTVNVRQAPAQIVSAIPLKPAAGIRFDNPAFVAPYAQGLPTLDAKGVDGRIDDADAGWKGRGLWTTFGSRTPFHMETGKGTRPKVYNFQMRETPLDH